MMTNGVRNDSKSAPISMYTKTMASISAEKIETNASVIILDDRPEPIVVPATTGIFFSALSTAWLRFPIWYPLAMPALMVTTFWRFLRSILFGANACSTVATSLR